MKIEEYADKHLHYLSGEINNKDIKRLIKKANNDKFVDIGCGDGSLLYGIHKLGYSTNFKEIWAVDLSENRLRSVKNISDNIKTVQDDAQFLNNLPDNYFNLVISTQVIEHVKDDNEMARSLYRIAMDKATVYIDTVFKKKWAWYFYKNHYGKWALDPTHEREYEKNDELLPKLIEAGFSIVKEKKSIQTFPLIDFFIRRLKIKNMKIYENPVIKLLRKISVPIPGYYCWKILLKK